MTIGAWFPRLGAARIVALFVLALSGVVAAFATISPAPEPIPASIPAVPETLAIPSDAVIAPPKVYTRETQFARGDTLSDLLRKLGVEGSEASRLLQLGTTNRRRSR